MIAEFTDEESILETMTNEGLVHFRPSLPINTMRGSHLHNRYRGEPTGLPSDLNHTAFLKGDDRVVHHKNTGKEFKLTGEARAAYDGYAIGTRDGNDQANALVDALASGQDFVGAEAL